jgi:hypothetical protein
MHINDCAEAIAFTDLVLDRETRLRSELYEEVDRLTQALQKLRWEKERCENTVFRFVKRFGVLSETKSPPILPVFAEACANFDKASESFPPDAIVFARPVLNVLVAERVSQRFFSYTGFFNCEQFMRIMRMCLERIVPDTDITGATITFYDGMMVLHPVLNSI